MYSYCNHDETCSARLRSSSVSPLSALSRQDGCSDDHADHDRDGHNGDGSVILTCTMVPEEGSDDKMVIVVDPTTHPSNTIIIPHPITNNNNTGMMDHDDGDEVMIDAPIMDHSTTIKGDDDDDDDLAVHGAAITVHDASSSSSALLSSSRHASNAMHATEDRTDDSHATISQHHHHYSSHQITTVVSSISLSHTNGIMHRDDRHNHATTMTRLPYFFVSIPEREEREHKFHVPPCLYPLLSNHDTIWRMHQWYLAQYWKWQRIPQRFEKAIEYYEDMDGNNVPDLFKMMDLYDAFFYFDALPRGAILYCGDNHLWSEMKIGMKVSWTGFACAEWAPNFSSASRVLYVVHVDCDDIHAIPLEWLHNSPLDSTHLFLEPVDIIIRYMESYENYMQRLKKTQEHNIHGGCRTDHRHAHDDDSHHVVSTMTTHTTASVSSIAITTTGDEFAWYGIEVEGNSPTLVPYTCDPPPHTIIHLSIVRPKKHAHVARPSPRPLSLFSARFNRAAGSVAPCITTLDHIDHARINNKNMMIPTAVSTATAITDTIDDDEHMVNNHDVQKCHVSTLETMLLHQQDYDAYMTQTRYHHHHSRYCHWNRSSCTLYPGDVQFIMTIS